MIAINDGIVLRNHIPRILKNHFREKSYYVDLLDLFNEVLQLFSFDGPGQFVFTLLTKILMFSGGIPNCFRTDDRFNYHY